MRVWPRSLLGQVLLAVAAALLVAQAISAVLLFRAVTFWAPVPLGLLSYRTLRR